MSGKTNFWLRMKRANPGFDSDPSTIVKLTLAELRKFVDKAHDAGFESGMEVARICKSKGQRKFEDLMGLFK